jgi:hypothetical protein
MQQSNPKQVPPRIASSRYMRQHQAMTHHSFRQQSRTALIAATFLSVATVAAAVDSAAASASAAADAQSRISSLIGDASCDTQSQCRTVGIGARPCGGPESWLAWSTKATDARALQEAVQVQAQAAKEANQRSGLASDCRVRPEPTVVCRPRAGDGKKTCQLGQGGVDSAV